MFPTNQTVAIGGIAVFPCFLHRLDNMRSVKVSTHLSRLSQKDHSWQLFLPGAQSGRLVQQAYGYLQLSNVTKEDSAMYRCSIDIEVNKIRKTFTSDAFLNVSDSTELGHCHAQPAAGSCNGTLYFKNRFKMRHSCDKVPKDMCGHAAQHFHSREKCTQKCTYLVNTSCGKKGISKVVGDSFTMNCSVSATSEVDLTWSFSNGSSSYGSSLPLSALVAKWPKVQSAGSIHIPSVLEEHTGHYTCKASTLDKSHSCSVALTVHRRLHAVVEPQELVIDSSNAHRISCASRTKEPVEISWLYNGLPLSSSTQLAAVASLPYSSSINTSFIEPGLLQCVVQAADSTRTAREERLVVAIYRKYCLGQSHSPMPWHTMRPWHTIQCSAALCRLTIRNVGIISCCSTLGIT